MAIHLDSHFSSRQDRAFIERYLSRAIAEAHSVNAASWCVTETNSWTKLHVGQLGVLYLTSEGANIIVDSRTISRAEVKRLGGDIMSAVSWIPDCLFVGLWDDVPEQLRQVQPAFASVVRSAAAKQRIVRAQARRLHSRQLVDTLRSRGHRLAQPAFV